MSRVGAIGATKPVTASTAPAANSGGTPISTSPRVLGVKPILQQGNGCGTAALAMALSYLLGRPVTQKEVDAQIRLSDVFTSPSNMRDFAKKNGISARLVNNLTDAEVIQDLNQNRPIVFLTDLTPNNKTDVAMMHWRVIDGYQWSNGQLMLHIADPWDSTYWKSWNELQPEWGHIHAIGLQTGYNRFGIELANQGVLGPDRLKGVFAVETGVDGTSDLINDSNRVGQGKIGNIFNIVIDILRMILSILLYPFQLLGGSDHTSGKTAQPPAQTSANVAQVRPKVATQPLASAQSSKKAAAWDGGANRLAAGAAVTRPVSNKTLGQGLRAPVVKRRTAAVA